MKHLTIDIEWDPADDDKLLCLSYAFGDEDGTLGGIATLGPDAFENRGRWSPEVDDLKGALARPDITKVAFTKADWRWLMRNGIDVIGPLHDVQVMAWVISENQLLSLDAVSKRYLGTDPDKRLRRRAGQVLFASDDGTEYPIGQAPWRELTEYNRRDVKHTWALYTVLRQELDETDWLDYFETEEVPFTEVLVRMEAAGLPIDLQRNEQLRAFLEGEAVRQETHLRDTGGLPLSFNLGSNDQVAAYLYSFRMQVVDRIRIPDEVKGCLRMPKRKGDVCGAGHKYEWECQGMDLPPGFVSTRTGRDYIEGHWSVKGRNLTSSETTEGGKQSVSTPVLMTYHAQDEWVRDLILWRKTTKLLTTYLRKFPVIAKDGRIYGRFNQTGTKTGRLSSSDPNLQNIPARGKLGTEVRALFRGDLIVGDYSQLEPRLLAHYSQDPHLLRVYREGLDVYALTGEAIFGMTIEKGMVERDIAKTVFLGTQYGAGPAKLAQILALNGFPTTVATAREYLRELEAFYRVAYDWKDEVIKHVHRTGYVTTLAGRHRRLRGAFADRRNFKLVGYGERQAVNAIIQGSAGDVVRRVMVKQAYLFENTLRLLAQVHDELVWEVMSQGTYETPSVLMSDIKAMAEVQHGFDLSVPLVFEPHFGLSWAEAKDGEGVDLSPLDDEDEDE